MALFLIFSSRLSADEYLLGPVLNGYYVDLKDGFLFTPKSNLFLRYFQGVNSMVKLGWDSYLNVVTFQMFPALLSNYFGSAAAIFQGSVFIVGILAFCRLLFRKVFAIQENILRNSSIFFIGLCLGLSVANYNSTRSHFGLFPLTGIRFGLYTFHAWILLAMIFWLAHCVTKGRQISWKFTIASMLAVGLLSLWYVTFWLAVIFAIFLVSLILPIFGKRKNQLLIVRTLLLTLASLYLQTGQFGGTLKRTTLGSKSTIELIQTFLTDTMLKFDSRLYSYEVWSLVFGPQTLMGFAVGLIISIYSSNNSIKVNETTKVFVYTMCGLCGFLPILFVFQEYMTYIAWWHRTTPIVLSFTTSVILSMVLMAWIRGKQLDPRKTTMAILVFSSFVTFNAASELRTNLITVNDFRKSWDSGDPFGRTSPISNYEIWNIKNFMHLKPFRHPTWTPPNLLLESINPLLVTGLVSGTDNPLALGALTNASKLIGQSSPFDVELGNTVEYKIEIRFSKSLPDKIHRVRIDDGLNTREMLIIGKQLTVISGNVPQPGAVDIQVVDECKTLTTESSEQGGCFEVVSYVYDFTQMFRNEWGL